MRSLILFIVSPLSYFFITGAFDVLFGAIFYCKSILFCMDLFECFKISDLNIDKLGN